MLREELHLHLYGCLSADDVWHLAQPIWEERKGALSWYADEYLKAWGRRPEWERYWTEEDGLQRLRADYEFVNYADFASFQACFNLLIALFPLRPDDDSILRYILEKYSKSDLDYAEFRVPFGIRFAEDKDGIFQFLTLFSRRILENGKAHKFQARLAISLSRDPKDLNFQYECLREWLNIHYELSEAIVAIDFCGAEEDWAPETKKDFFKKVLEDNQVYPETALAILYHVGESFEKVGIETSIQWVREAHEFGAHRLGHCISLGIDPLELLERGYSPSRIEQIRKLQDDTMKELKSKGLIVESCPKSNMWIGKIRKLEHHPLQRFVKNGLNLVISSDDPGIFKSSLKDEVSFALDSLGLSQNQILEIAKFTPSARSSVLAKRYR